MSLADPITYSTRRRYLDRDLGTASRLLRGRILELGAGRAGRRGLFRPPTDGVTSWIYVDRDLTRSPHVCADVTHLPIRSAAFDVVVCLEVLEYVWTPPVALKEMRRLLAPGGTLLLSTPFLHRVDTADDYWRFTEPGLRRLLHEAGFDVLECTAQGRALAVLTSVLRYTVSVQPSGMKRLLSIVLRPLFATLLSADPGAARRHPALATFTTGYLVIARSRRPETGGPAPA